MRGTKKYLLCLAMLPGFAHAADCADLVREGPQPLRPTVLLPVAAELSAPSYQLGAQSGVLAHAYDESQSVDQVLLRLRIEACRTVAMAAPAPTPVPDAIEPVAPVDPNDPAVYKPKTEFDNTPWRFNMQQGGKQMTADEFDAWMKSRGVRVVKARAAAPAEVPQEAPLQTDAGTPSAPAAGTPPGATPPAQPASAPAADTGQEADEKGADETGGTPR
ncbi:hypothetical protein GCM10023332_22910 [Luteimonas vadosa]|uniref:Secreted protein n=1 Tax=Luteimonas vadosa TaxID=1165507 RepID=A0ABP9E912_9GAMM